MFLEDNTFEIMELENDILYESIHLDILKYSIMEDVYIEQGESSSKFKTFVNNIIEKIKKFFINAKNAIINFFTKKAVNDKLDDIEQSIEKNPELGKREVKIPDYKELDKLYEKTISDLEHRVEDSEKIMEKYKKERKRILIGAAGLTTVSLATAIGIVKNIGKKTEERLNEKIEHDIDYSACKIYETVERNMNHSEESNQRWANLYASIMRDKASDSVKEVKDTVSAVVNNSKGE